MHTIPFHQKHKYGLWLMTHGYMVNTHYFEAVKVLNKHNVFFLSMKFEVAA